MRIPRSQPVPYAICTLTLMVIVVGALSSGPEATARSENATPYVPDPSECTIEPRPIPSPPLTSAASTSPSATLPPPGPLVPSDTIAEITAVVEGAIACTNAGNTLRALAYFTDQYVANMFTGPESVDFEGFLQYLTTPVAALDPSDRLAIVSISDVRSLGEGMVSAVVTTKNAEDQFVDFVVFVNVDGRWLIAGSSPAETAYATPSP